MAEGLLSKTLGSLNDSIVVQKLKILKEKMKRLTARKDDICAECNQAELQVGKRKRLEVVDWLDTYKLKRSKFESIVDECQKSRGFVTNMQLNDRINVMTKEVDDLFEVSHFLNGLVLDDPKAKEVAFNLEPFYGELFQKNVRMILEWLDDHPLAYSIGVLGMGGIGKTTLMKNIYNHLLGDWRVIWVTVSSDCNLYMLQEKVAKAIDVKLSSEADTDKRASELHHSFVMMKKNVVLFLDDVWEKFQLSSIGIPNKEKGCKINIILSTRKEDVCRMMGCKNYVIRVQVLSEHEAWDLFKNKLETYDDLCFEGQEIAKLVAKECACLPLATIVIARSMIGVFDVLVWKNALAELKNPSRGHEDMDEKVLQKLKFSYDRLNNELLKQCFLSCVLYPEDSPIYNKSLIEYWIMEGMLDDKGSRLEKMYKGYDLLEKLKNACLLESFTNECVKMHDVVRDMAISITNCGPRFLVKSGKQLREVLEEGLWSRDLVKVSLSANYDITVIPYGMAPRTPILTVLKLSHLSITKIPEPFFDHMRALKILDLSYSRIKRVPEGVSKLENLRALLLDGCKELTYLPSLEKLTNLRVLDLDYYSKLEEGVRGMEGLEKLEKVAYCPWIINNDMTGFNRLIQRSHQLSCYRFWLTSHDHFDLNESPFNGISWLSFEEYLQSEGILSMEYLESERILYITGVEFGEETSLLPTSIEVLIIKKVNIKGKRALTDIFPSLVGALKLESIDITQCIGLEYIFTGTQQLDVLEILKLTELSDLTRIVEFGSCSFFQLVVLEIIKCPKLKVVFPFNKHWNLPNLRILEVGNCDLLERIFESNNGTLPNLVLSLPRLEELYLDCLPKLHCIYEGLIVCDYLQELEIDECPELRVLNDIKHIICPASPSTLASISKDAEFWEIFQQYEPLNVTQISYKINQILEYVRCEVIADIVF
ncbi:probable disease resistance protein At1g61300 [Amaranthus tricolor]|uniref:probable disease resistance protein At1g61300 n=1 Tax=Amaranthus tricolor TaxID=29722 RepID=UPI00258F921D|nr:probable disease resistance protein At1g61300 [Amaranthus tricolor]